MATSIGPGWAGPNSQGFNDVRLQGRDGRRYGPLPRSWARYRGLYHHGNQVILSYTVGDVPVLDEDRLSGIVYRGDLIRYLQTRQELGEAREVASSLRE